MARVRLIHWNADEAKEKARRLRGAGYVVDATPLRGAAGLRALKTNPPAAVVIDLSRLPMQGRDVGIAIRHFPSTRHLPVVFVEGEPAKVVRVQKHLPDAVFATWDRIRSSLQRAMARPPVDPVAPRSLLAGYSGKPLATKLGIRPRSILNLLGAPPGFERKLGRLPAGAKVRRGGRGGGDLMLWFTKSRKELERGIKSKVPQVGRGGLWIVWPKKSSGIASDLTQVEVRKIGMASGLVDYKICSLDSTWTGLRFSRRDP